MNVLFNDVSHPTSLHLNPFPKKMLQILRPQIVFKYKILTHLFRPFF